MEDDWGINARKLTIMVQPRSTDATIVPLAGVENAVNRGIVRLILRPTTFCPSPDAAAAPALADELEEEEDEDDAAAAAAAIIKHECEMLSQTGGALQSAAAPTTKPSFHSNTPTPLEDRS